MVHILVHQAGLHSEDVVIFIAVIKKELVRDRKKSVCVQLFFSSDGLDIDKETLLGPLPQVLDPLQLAAVECEARPGSQLQQGTGDRHEHQHVEAAQAQRRSP